MIVVNANKNIDIIKNILPIEPKWYVSECDISFIPSFALISLYGEDSTIIEVQVHINIVIMYTPSIWSSPSCFGVLLLEEEGYTCGTYRGFACEYVSFYTSYYYK